MPDFSLSHVSDRDLLRDLASLVAQERDMTAALAAHVAEVDARKLNLPARDFLPPEVEPVSQERFLLQLTIGQDTYDKLRYAHALLGHQDSSEDFAEVIGLALKALIASRGA